MKQKITPESPKVATKKALGREEIERRHLVRRKAKFLEVYRKTGMVKLAAEAVGVERSTPRDWARKDPDFEKAWEESEPYIADHLEDVAIKRAEAGSDTLTIFLLKGFRKKRHRERYDIHNQTELVCKIRATDLTDDQLAEIIAKGEDDVE